MPRVRRSKSTSPQDIARDKARKRRWELHFLKRSEEKKSVETLVNSPPKKRSRKGDLFDSHPRTPRKLDHDRTTEVTASKLFFSGKKNTGTSSSESEPAKAPSPTTSNDGHSNARAETHPCPSFIPHGREIFSIFGIITAVQQIFLHAKECVKADTILTPSCITWSSKFILSFVCCCGWQASMASDSMHESYPINDAVALACAAVPIGYEDIRTLFTILELSPPTKTSFENRSRKKIKAQMDIAFKKSLTAAGDEERRLAIEAEDYVIFKGQKVPAIKVVCDGSWSKRSYGHSYSSNYGTAAIIGVRTKKVLFVGERVKTCKICIENGKTKKEVPHVCSKNWSGPSTAMEADIIHEGFSKSFEMHGIIYAYFVADGDSSTYSRIRNVYDGITVDKIECINHVLRNLNTKLRNIAGNSVRRRCISKEERSVPRMESRFKRVGLAVQSAVRYYKDLGNWNTNWLHLRDDIKNIPFHIFGRHINCKDYFKCSMAGKEEDLVDQFKSKPLFLELVDAIDRVASLSRSLIRKENSNIVECFFSVVAKYLEGKRKNLSSASLYHQRIVGATLSFNTNKFWAADLYKMNYLKSPCVKWKLEKKRSIRFRNRVSSSKKPRVINFPFLKAGKGDENYGSDPARPDLSEETLLVEMSSIVMDVEVTKQRQTEIEQSTMDQASNILWKRERRLRLTASNAKRIYSMQDSTDNEATLRQLLSNSEFTNSATTFGRTHEADAIAEYENMKGYGTGAVKRCGLFVSLENGCLAASPDGIIGDDGLLEVKCPITATNMTIVEWATKHKNLSSVVLKEDGLKMKQDHAHFYQVIMQIFVTGRQYCDYFIWSPGGDFFLQRVVRDSETIVIWEKMKTKLLRFWNYDLLPELADSRLNRKMKPRLPEYRLAAIKKKAERTNGRRRHTATDCPGVCSGNNTTTQKTAVVTRRAPRVCNARSSSECSGDTEGCNHFSKLPT